MKATLRKMRVERDTKYRGYRYLVAAMPQGHRCGYVRIPKGHVLYGVDYFGQVPVKFEEISRGEVGKRGVIPLLWAGSLKPQDNVSMDMLFDVHGSLTFSGGLLGKRGWWIGFDCAHIGDGKDVSIMDKDHLDLEQKYQLNIGGVIRTASYVEKECERLIDQIIKWFEAKEK